MNYHEINIMPRQSGKTTKIINRFLEEESLSRKVIILVKDEHTKKSIGNSILSNGCCITNSLNDVTKNIFAVNSFLALKNREELMFRMKEPMTVLVDEYFFFSPENIRELSYFANDLRDFNVKFEVYSTSSKKLSAQIIDVCKHIHSLEDLKLYNYASLLRKKLMEENSTTEFSWYLDNLLTNPKTITKVFSIFPHQKMGLSKEQFELEILGDVMIRENEENKTRGIIK